MAEATDCTFVEASSEAAATVVVTCCARSAVLVRVPADASSSVEAEDTVGFGDHMPSLDIGERPSVKFPCAHVLALELAGENAGLWL